MQAPPPTAGPPAPAPDRPLPQVHFYSIEYPGYVRPSSVPQAIRNLGGQPTIDRVFKRPAQHANVNIGGAPRPEALLELSLRPGNPFAHPIPGDVVSANNLLMKVTKRRRKRHDGVEVEGEGEYVVEVVGVLAKTARFRSMVDYQYFPDPQDPVTQLRSALDTMDVEALCSYVIPPEPADVMAVAVPVAVTPMHTPTPPPPPPVIDPSLSLNSTPNPSPITAEANDDAMDVEDDMYLDPRLRAISQAQVQTQAQAQAQAQTQLQMQTSSPQPQVQPPAPLQVPNDVTQIQPAPVQTQPKMPTSALRLFPPPLFSRQTIPQGYNFKANTASMISTAVDEETGEERKRLINRMRWKGYGPASIMFADAHVPDKPPQAVQEGRHQISENILAKLEALFTNRPIWTRQSLFNQFSSSEARDILNSKLLLPLCCYVFQDGPWRDTLVRFSYDPRKDPSSRFYQRLYFRNANHPISRPSVTARRQTRPALNEQMKDDVERKTSHIFDGQTITKETAAFQLCDITDPMLKEMIEDPDALRETCNERDGWYTTHAFEQIKTVLRHKFFSLLEGHPATDAECHALLAASDGSVKAALAHRSAKLRAGKHNMAKGALRPEDAAALRLRATLDRSMKSFSTQRQT